MTTLTLRVAEAIQEDVDKGIARIDAGSMNQIGVRPGDILQIEGERTTVAIVDRAYPSDVGLGIIRMDGTIRRNAKSSIGDTVKVTKTEVKEAKKVIIAPAQKGIVVRASPDLFKHGLLGRALVKGDLVSLGGTRRRRTALSHSPFFDDAFNIFDENLFGFGFADLKFVVASSNPKGPVLVTESTEVVFNPEAVDLSEEEMIGVSYEDIGGLDEEITKVREMVELPLKHPEIFERLGIEPPKGVLLHGPPGTGKTLLAKAVANETNSHFILINGPSVMSKFYGESLPGHEKVLIKHEGKYKRLPIREIVNKDMKEIQAVCFDDEGKVQVKPVTSLIKHKRKSKLMTVTTRSGRSIEVTDDHSLFTLTEKGIADVKTSELVAKQSFIAVPKKIPFISDGLFELNLLELIKQKKQDYGLRIRNPELLQKAIKIVGVDRAAKLLNVTKKYTYDLVSKRVAVPALRFLSLMEVADVPVNPRITQLTTEKTYFPAILTLSNELMEFFGVWLAEGSYYKRGGICLSIHKAEEPYVANLCQKLFGTVGTYHKPSSETSDVFVCSKTLSVVMEHLLGFRSDAKNKIIPSFVYNVGKQQLGALLRGYFSGDGHLNRATPAPMIELCTASKSLADDMLYSLLHFGVVAKIYYRKKHDHYRISFADVENLDNFLEIGFFDESKNAYIAQYVRTHNEKRRRDRIPFTAVKTSLEEKYGQNHAWKSCKSVGREVLQQLEAPSLKLLLDSDIYWDQVIKVEESRCQDEFVYDLSVPGAENFISGFGGIYAHNSEANLRKIFEEAEKNAPSIIFIDEIDAIAPKREEMKGEVERRVVAQLLALMDGLQSRGKVVVIAATNLPNVLDPALRRPGRFDREIEIGVANKEGRHQILQIHTRNMPLAKNVNLMRLAEITHGFVGADLSSLAKEAAMIVLRRLLPDLNSKLKEGEAIPNELLQKLYITQKDFVDALKIVRPSAMREVLIESPNVKWDDVGGMNVIKQELREAIEWPLKHPDAFTRLGVKPPKGILLYGAPGTGKTLLAKAVATEAEANFIPVAGPSLLSKWVGESEKAVREVFKKARQVSPTIVFFDEIDSLAPKRSASSSDSMVTERVVNQLLTEMDGLQAMHDVVIVAATNRPDMLDTALLRPGRFDRIILTSVPDEATREKVFAIHTKNMPLAKDVNLKQLAKKTDGYVGADIEAVCREAAILSLRDDLKTKQISAKYFDKALEKVPPSVTDAISQAYEELKTHFSSARAKQMQEEKPSYMG